MSWNYLLDSCEVFYTVHWPTCTYKCLLIFFFDLYLPVESNRFCTHCRRKAINFKVCKNCLQLFIDSKECSIPSNWLPICVVHQKHIRIQSEWVKEQTGGGLRRHEPHLNKRNRRKVSTCKIWIVLISLCIFLFFVQHSDSSMVNTVHYIYATADTRFLFT